ncbi:putative beta-D-xylosidase 7 [Hibiscus syriacus]|uniref:Beta-D-xylosidase 7 n=1 Tax=Hibiscus syriacus TaxID=106335 RepID=A0A6A3BH62_HIBSY|nr:putative beta-D-xylosidase 7 [Hibiscus syriacus]
MLKKESFQWSEDAKEAFMLLKEAMCNAPMLALSNFTKKLSLETDSSSKGIGVVLSQEGKPVDEEESYLHDELAKRTITAIAVRQESVIDWTYHKGILRFKGKVYIGEGSSLRGSSTVRSRFVLESIGILPLGCSEWHCSSEKLRQAPSTFKNQNYFPFKPVTPLQGLKSYVKDIRYHQGCDAVNCSAFTARAVKIAKGADHVVLVMGLDQTQERQDHDGVDLVLPPKQQNLISTIARVAKNPVILVLQSGGPVDMLFAENDKCIGGILWTDYPGEVGGRALAEIIFDDHNPGRTYRFYQGPKVFEFGYGLSYSNYIYQFLPATQDKVYLNNQSSSQMVKNSSLLRYMPVSEMGTEACDKMKYPVTVRVQNDSNMDGKHPLLLFVWPEKASNGRSVKQFVAFQSVNFNAGERADIEFELRPVSIFAQPMKMV